MDQPGETFIPMTPSPATEKSRSTGPKTPEGKRRSAMNALRHGLTGRVVVLPSEDMDTYYAFCNKLMKDLAPEGALEEQYAQTFCDTQWRLNRIRGMEDSMLSLGHFEEAGDIEVDHPEIHAAFTIARVFREQSNEFVNLSLYEQRLNRTLEKSLRQLKELQAERQAACKAALDEAVTLRNFRKMKGEPIDPAIDSFPSRFVFSIREIEAEVRRQSRLADAREARSFDYNLAKLRKFGRREAAA